MKEKPTEEKLKSNLEYLALSLAMPTNSALRAAVVQFAALAWFMHQGEEMYVTNPANTLPYLGMRALEEQSLLEAHERYTVTRNICPVNFRPGKAIDLLRQHRDVIGHPATFEWGSDHKNQFYKDSSFSHFRCGVLWDIVKKLDEALVAQGSAPRLATLPTDVHMGETLNLILRLAVKPEFHSVILPGKLLSAYLASQRDAFIRVLERYPDGKQPMLDDLGDE